ncbi:MAG: tetratricopeptide repeat protein [Anaerolineales bacterium]|nr:tetratricopeptide repeat protein [Anaerolineales bacterium]
MPHNVHPTPFIIRPSNEFAKDIDLRNLSRSLATKYADGHVVTDDDLQIMGRNLWGLLGVQDDFDLVQKEAGDAILSVIIESDNPEVQAYPWETLYHPTHKFIGRNPAFTLTRRIAAGKSSQANLDKGPLRVLLFTSLPDNVDAERGRLNVEEEQAQVQEALMPWIAKGVVRLEMPDDGRFSTLKELLKRFDPHVLFLSGHGKFHHEPHADEAYGEFWFESETGDGEAIRDEEIARALGETRVQAVILSACESGKAASDSLSNGLMQRISAAGIPHVIGMRESILDIAGIQFARALCDALAGQERVDVALQSARAAIQKAMDERGQWCLPMALSPNPQAQLIDWDFQPQIVESQRLNQRVNTVSLPARFVGRRAEMRRYKIKLTQGALRSLLITGAGGMGKTALVGKLALDVQKPRGDGLFAWSANSEKSWRDFELEMAQTLDKPRVERYDKFLPTAENEMERAKFMLDLLAEQFNGRVILFFDNLETLQDADSLAVKDATVAAWMQAARDTDGVTVFATSRWQISDWDGEHLMLARANYGDFLQIAAMKNLPIKREQMRRVYGALGGNIRGLEFFASAAQGMHDENAEEAFLQTLEQTKSDLQANMAIAEIYKRLPDDAKKLLARLPAYYEAVPIEGLLKLGQDFPDAETLLERLMAVSLLEASYEPHWDVTEYQCTPLATDWMNENGLVDNSSEWLNATADYHLYLMNEERRSAGQAIAAHHALRRAERHDEADRLTLKHIIKPLKMAGFYTTLLSDWLPRICDSENIKTRGVALNEMGILCLNIGNHEVALSYLKHSLAISQQIGDKRGEGSTYNNISQIYSFRGDYESALSYLKQSLNICQQIGDKAGATLNNISQIYSFRGDYETALSYLKQSLAVSQQISDKEGEAAALGNISNIFYAKGDYETALSYLKQSLIIRQQIGDKAGEGTTLNDIGVYYHRGRGDYETALAYLKQSLVIRQQIGDKESEGATLNNISQLYDDQGDFETALAYLKQSLAICQQIGDKAGEGTALGNIGNIFYAKGEHETALAYLKQSLAICQQIGDKAGEGVTLHDISLYYRTRGDYEIALTYLQQSLAIQQQIGDITCEGTTLNSISQIYSDQGDHETALAYLKKSLAIAQQVGDKLGEGSALNNISQIYSHRGDYETALSYLKKSLAIQQQIGDSAGLCSSLFNIGQIHRHNNQIQEAISAWVNSYVIAKQIGYARVLQELTALASQLGLSGGLEGWEQLTHKIRNEVESEEDELEKVKRFVHVVIQSAFKKSSEAGKYFQSVSKMAMDSNTPPEYQELGKVLRNYMAGLKNPDLSRLTEEIRQIVEDELGNK